MICLSEFYPELTGFLVNFIPVSSTVPVCCIATQRNVTLFAVEYKNMRIRHKYLCIIMQKIH